MYTLFNYAQLGTSKVFFKELNSHLMITVSEVLTSRKLEAVPFRDEFLLEGAQGKIRSMFVMSGALFRTEWKRASRKTNNRDSPRRSVVRTIHKSKGILMTSLSRPVEPQMRHTYEFSMFIATSPF